MATHARRKALSVLTAAASALVLVACGSAGSTESTGGGESTDGGESGDGDFYAGKRLRILVSWEPGGTGDIYARIFARYLPEYIPGSPQVIVENVAGGGHTILPNQLYTSTEPDGLTIGTFASHRIVADIIDEEGVEYSAQEFDWVGNFTALPAVCFAWHTAGIESFEQFLESDDPWILGNESPGSIENVVPTLMADDLGVNVQRIGGYGGFADMLLAMEQGEIEGTCNVWGSVIRGNPELVEENKIIPIFIAGADRIQELPDIPAMTEFDWSDEYAEVVDAYVARLQITVPVAAPPGVPEDRLEILRTAFEQTLENKEFQDEIARAALPLDQPLNGEDTAAVVDGMFNASSDAWDIIAAIQNVQ